MQLQLYEQRQAELAAKIAALRAAADDGNGNGNGNGNEQDEEEKQSSGSRPNIIGNAEEVEAEQEEMQSSGVNVASPFIRTMPQ